MPFKVSEVKTDFEFTELIAWPNARQESLEECTQRQLEWHRSDPSSYWQKVTDTATGEIVAGALWKLYSENPFEKEDHEEAYWYPEGGQREYVNGALEIFGRPRATMGRRPHVYLNIIFTRSDYRRQGAGDLIMNWGITKAQEMGVEMWLDATPYGVPLYKKYGFVTVIENPLNPKKDDPDDEWKQLDQELGPLSMTVMWRPASGLYEEGKTVFPWNGSTGLSR
ncbi:hypothetical protein M7I_7841 [Glarea lozoyensis 74030]|uniref:N-acetyltransferase domain-containing protein n=1 Tax=Glarea lozoyensis (strain ATCC 74030 / MF5533) TaxID=1104152 RepID=H0EYE2_GLAL7|nr:hypothetical protein M7I_7841 [Glarea lozoyensis 74030]